MTSCPSCGGENVDGARFCVKCGATLAPTPAPESWRTSGSLNQPPTEQADPSTGTATGGYAPPSYQNYPTYNAPQGMMYQQPGAGTNWQEMGANKKLAAGLCGILIGAFGIHKFILGYTTEGVIMLLATLLTCGFAGMVTGVIGIVEGVIYLTKTDEEFVRTYVQNKKGWF
ncbi:MAG: TM2 domain-containing protein [Pyrinomonadaceae bacterium]